jgi:hypothetical protein
MSTYIDTERKLIGDMKKWAQLEFSTRKLRHMKSFHLENIHHQEALVAQLTMELRELREQQAIEQQAIEQQAIESEDTESDTESESEEDFPDDFVGPHHTIIAAADALHGLGIPCHAERVTSKLWKLLKPTRKRKRKPKRKHKHKRQRISRRV